MKTAPRILILNDAYAEAIQLQEMLKSEKYEYVIIANKSKEALRMVKTFGVDLVLIKISNDGAMDGINAAKDIQEFKYTPIIYISDFLHENTIAKARKTRPFAFIVKPYLVDQISIAIDAALFIQPAAENLIHPEKNIAGPKKNLTEDVAVVTSHQVVYVKENYKFVKISLSEVLYLQANNNHTTITTKDRMYIVRNSLQYLIDKFNSLQFVRVHRSYVVNTLHIISFDESTLLVGKKEIPLSKNHKNAFSRSFTIL